MIERQVIDTVIERATANIVDIIGDYVQLRKRGVNHVGCCPFHKEKTGSFTVSQTKGFYKCFGCGEGGNVVSFVMKHDHLTFPEAIKTLGRRLGIEVVDKELTPEMQAEQSRRESLLTVTDYAKKHFQHNLWATQEGQSLGLTYFRHRGFRDDIIKGFELGYAFAQRDYFTQSATRDGYKLEYLTAAGLTIEGENGYRADRFRERVIFPIHNVNGKVVAFGGRVMQTDPKLAKYINSPESELYVKNEIVYGLFHAKNEIARTDRVYLVEGYTDVISMHQAGLKNVIASCGTSLTTNQIKLIQRFSKNITVLYDGDSAGIHASLRGIDMLLAEGMNVKVMLLPDGEDPDSFAHTHTAEEYKNYIEERQTDFIRFETNVLLKDAGNDPIRKSAAVNTIVASIAVCPDRILREYYIKDTATLLNISESTLYGALEAKLISEAQKAEHKESMRLLREADQQRYAANATPMGGGTQNSQQTGATKTPQTNATDNSEETEILRYFLRYMNKPLFVGSDDETTVAEYISDSLKRDEDDGYVIKYQALQYVINVFRTGNNVTAQTFFKSADPDFVRLAVNLSNPEYQLSRMHMRFGAIEGEEDNLDIYVPKTINQLRLRWIKQATADTLKRLEAPDLTNDEIEALVRKVAHWNAVKAKICKETLGERLELQPNVC